MKVRCGRPQVAPTGRCEHSALPFVVDRRGRRSLQGKIKICLGLPSPCGEGNANKSYHTCWDGRPRQSGIYQYPTLFSLFHRIHKINKHSRGIGAGHGENVCKRFNQALSCGRGGTAAVGEEFLCFLEHLIRLLLRKIHLLPLEKAFCQCEHSVLPFIADDRWSPLRVCADTACCRFLREGRPLPYGVNIIVYL